MAVSSEQNLDQRRRRRLRALIAATESEGARLEFWARSLSLLVIGVVFAAVAEWNAAFGYTIATLLVFFLTGLLNYRLAMSGRRRPWMSVLSATFDIAFLTFLIIAPNPFAAENPPAAMHLREAGFKYLLILVCLGALSLSPRLAVWLGIAAAVSWSLGVLWVVMQPETIIALVPPQDLSSAERLSLNFNPNYVDLVEQLTHVVVILIVAGIIATVVSRARQLADDYIKAERARINLSRHFSPNVVDELATNDEPFGPIRRQDIAVLFADIVGFTAYTEDHLPEQVFQMLREFHGRMEQVVFEHRGTVDNYIGDCIMATFGVPRATPDDAARLLRAARGMITSLNAWNLQRKAAGLDAGGHPHRLPVRAGGARRGRQRAQSVGRRRRRHRQCGKPHAGHVQGARRRHLRRRAGDRGGVARRRSRGERRFRQPRPDPCARQGRPGRRVVPAESGKPEELTG